VLPLLLRRRLKRPQSSRPFRDSKLTFVRDNCVVQHRDTISRDALSHLRFSLLWVSLMMLRLRPEWFASFRCNLGRNPIETLVTMSGVFGSLVCNSDVSGYPSMPADKGPIAIATGPLRTTSRMPIGRSSSISLLVSIGVPVTSRISDSLDRFTTRTRNSSITCGRTIARCVPVTDFNHGHLPRDGH
jgi:hypothetical protein